MTCLAVQTLFIRGPLRTVYECDVIDILPKLPYLARRTLCCKNDVTRINGYKKGNVKTERIIT